MDKEEFKKTLGIRLRYTRLRKNLSQNEVARYLRYSNNSWVSLWESGKTVPSIYTLIQLAILFDVSVDTLVLDNLKQEKERAVSPTVPSMG